MSDSVTKTSTSELAVSKKPHIEPVSTELDVDNNSTADLMNVKANSTARTRTVIIDASSSTSTDVGVQATPTAVSSDSSPSQKPHRGILPVTSDMRNSATNDSQNHSDNQASATNTKEKTPMCQVNELARYNKIAHKYVLVDEQGPAHRKEFKIRLDLGSTESYHATGSSIKRAQHAAAEVAISLTKLKRPAVKSLKVEPPPATPERKKVNVVTPTVELNAVAMKMGERADYVNLDVRRMPHPHHNYIYPIVPDFFPRYRIHPLYPPPFMPHMRPRASPTFSVLLRLGRHEFRGHGATRQLARHNAASKALKVLSNTSNQQTPPNNRESEPTDAFRVEGTPSPDATSSPVESAASPSSSDSKEESDGSCKSEISRVHEMALRMEKEITFEVIHESGPPHMRSFITRCVCGDLSSEGEGNSKRKSKKVAAELMLSKMKELNLPAAVSKQRIKNVANKKKNRNLIKMQKANVEYGSGINPISRLIQIQQANKRKEPVYSLVMEHGLPRRREFIMQVECNERTCQGKGPNKKLAKRNAAEEMLQVMGYSHQSPAPGKSVLKSPDHTCNSHSNKHVTFEDSQFPAKVPGVIVRADTNDISQGQRVPPFKADLAASLAKELLEKGKSVVGETLLPAKEHPKYPLKRPKEQLEYLGSCMGFSILFTDIPKGTNMNTCITVVTLQTNPSQTFNGSAPTVDESHDKAALQALNKLAQTVGQETSEETTPAACTKRTVEESNVEEASNAGGDATPPATNGDADHSGTRHTSDSKACTYSSQTTPDDEIAVP